MSQKKITNLILESIPMSKLAMVLANPMFKFNTPAMVYKEVDHELKTLEYLVKHFENNPKVSNPYLQLVSQHRKLIEQILNGLFFDTIGYALTDAGRRYEVLLYICDEVEKLKLQETVAEEMAAN